MGFERDLKMCKRISPEEGAMHLVKSRKKSFSEKDFEEMKNKLGIVFEEFNGPIVKGSPIGERIEAGFRWFDPEECEGSS